MTLRRTLIIAGSFGLLACSGTRETAVAPAGAELSPNTYAALYQNASAEVAWMYEQAYDLARMKLAANLANADSLPPAVVVDVDETVLDNSPYELENILAGRSYSPGTWKAWTDRASAKALPGALAFLQHAEELGCAIFYITNRTDEERAATVRNLNAHGFPMADEDHVLTKSSTSDKTARRASVAADHRIVLLVGDQLTDFDQVFRERGEDLGRGLLEDHQEALHRSFVLVPNATYGYWRDAVTGRGSPAEQQARIRGFLEERTRRP
ncbi:MAG: 5'-nucleotidase, lipoprotein e(P4) family [Flavobacteriales bacterium]|nr:5'-nucleotidase, lipoprotein e(P4) family [Flavobacteriales bacterium]MCB0782855.1 5'-nucleotidase, lipoprotein e(P4) family [Flavobacteriales bacterium]MCB0815587.1 5'-nucleotidase, lipoprotein e(P4) family [Flavobacteriales bacterium]